MTLNSPNQYSQYDDDDDNDSGSNYCWIDSPLSCGTDFYVPLYAKHSPTNEDCFFFGAKDYAGMASPMRSPFIRNNHPDARRIILSPFRENVKLESNQNIEKSTDHINEVTQLKPFESIQSLENTVEILNKMYSHEDEKNSKT